MSFYTSVAPWRVLAAAALFSCAFPGNSYSLMRYEVLDAAMDTSAFVRRQAKETTLLLSPVGDPEQSVTVHGQNRELYIPTTPDTEKVARNMSLCVPLIPEDIELFKMRFVPSLNAQTVLPSELIVAVSEVSEPAAVKLQLELRSLIANVPVSITAVDHVAMPGENRNRCAQQSRGEIVSFFDADDIMHPRRTEILDYVFQQYKPKVVLHNFVRHLDDIEEFGKTFECVSAGMANYSKASMDSNSSLIAQGWVTVSRDVFDRVHYNEERRTGEDVKLLDDIMDAYGTGSRAGTTLVSVRLGMGVYVPRRDRHKATEINRSTMVLQGLLNDYRREGLERHIKQHNSASEYVSLQQAALQLRKAKYFRRVREQMALAGMGAARQQT